MAALCMAARLSHQFPLDLAEAAIWKMVADSAAQGHLLVDLEQFTLSRHLPLGLLPPDEPHLATEGLHILAVTMTNRLLGPSEMEVVWRRDVVSPSCGDLAAWRCAHGG